MFSADETQVYFVRGVGDSQELFVTLTNGAGEERHLLTMAPLFPLSPFYDISSDGDIIWVRFEQESSEIWLTDLSN